MSTSYASQPSYGISQGLTKAVTCIAVEAETTTVIVFAYWALYLDMVRSARSNVREITDQLVVRKCDGVYVGTYAIVDMSGIYGYGQNEKVQVHFPKGTSHLFCEVFSVKATLNRTGESVVSPTGELTDSRCIERERRERDQRETRERCVAGQKKEAKTKFFNLTISKFEPNLKTFSFKYFINPVFFFIFLNFPVFFYIFSIFPFFILPVFGVVVFSYFIYKFLFFIIYTGFPEFEKTASPEKENSFFESDLSDLQKDF